MSIQKSNTAPTNPGQRVQIVDIIRGFALFGVLLVNMTLFKSTMFYWEPTPDAYIGFINIVSAWGIELFANNKFYPIFSFLFGLGFYFFASRAEKKGLQVNMLYRRRILGLMIFGLIHLVFIWSGDILHLYSVGGLLLLAVNSLSTKAIKKLMVLFFCLAILVQGGVKFSESLAEQDDLVPEIDPQEERMELKESAISTYQDGNFPEILGFRLINEVPFVLLNIAISLPDIMFLFLAGLLAGRTGIFFNIDKYWRQIKTVAKTGVSIGVLGTIIYVLIITESIGLPSVLKSPISETIFYVASIALAAAYVSVLTLLSRQESLLKFMSPFANVGKMALTNYLTQSLICVVIFYGYGAGLFQQISVFGGVILTLAIYLLQIFWSRAWMSKFKFGPFEWLWRGFTYRQLPKITIQD